MIDLENKLDWVLSTPLWVILVGIYNLPPWQDIRDLEFPRIKKIKNYIRIMILK